MNSAGSESGNAETCAGRVIPWLQDTPDEHVWAQWRIEYRDVIILDKDNMEVGVYNLTANDLAVPANYDALKNMLRAARQP